MSTHKKRQGQYNAIPLKQDRQQICVCYDVYSDEIIEAIQKGADSVEKVSDLTYSCQGCGSCRFKIEGLLQGIVCVSRE
ncbi:(2Fe-2S)-binding protein [Thiomicrorhabdus arctica]|uniref:(2Fe-2S)-binding protein n=1 Tax=Thiomicrorhabdus arctica TaxID=131540 RepID=UPI00036E8319|nr:(2Fe-2S)-binding protein [Thiomicrorhabdus arctica]